MAGNNPRTPLYDMLNNEMVFGNDTLNLIPTTSHFAGNKKSQAWKEYAWPAAPDKNAVTSIRFTTTDTEALVMPPHQNVNASGRKRPDYQGAVGQGDYGDPFR